MNNKEKFINDVNKKFKGKTKEILLNQIELFFYSKEDIQKKYDEDWKYLKEGDKLNWDY